MSEIVCKSPVMSLPVSLFEQLIQTTPTWWYGEVFPLTLMQNVQASRLFVVTSVVCFATTFRLRHRQHEMRQKPDLLCRYFFYVRLVCQGHYSSVPFTLPFKFFLFLFFSPFLSPHLFPFHSCHLFSFHFSSLSIIHFPSPSLPSFPCFSFSPSHVLLSCFFHLVTSLFFPLLTFAPHHHLQFLSSPLIFFPPLFFFPLSLLLTPIGPLSFHSSPRLFLFPTPFLLRYKEGKMK